MRHIDNRPPIRRSAWRKQLVVLIALVSFAIGLAATPAAASTRATVKSASTTGAAATCTVTRTSNIAGRYSCRLTDTAADGHSVYIVHQTSLFPARRCNWSGGAGNTGICSGSINSDGPFNWRFQVCRDRSWASDNCSAVVRF